MYKKIYSKCICLGFTWGIFSWIDFFSHTHVPSLINSVPVFLSIGISKVILTEHTFLFQKSIFILTALWGGLIGYLIASILVIIISVVRED